MSQPNPLFNVKTLTVWASVAQNSRHGLEDLTHIFYLQSNIPYSSYSTQNILTVHLGLFVSHIVFVLSAFCLVNKETILYEGFMYFRKFCTLGLTMAAVGTEFDICVPAFPDIMAAFAATPAAVQSVMTLNIQAMALSCLLIGPLSDRVGRRPVLLCGLCMFAVASLGCTVSGSLNSLRFWRLLQGMGGAACPVVGYAIVMDDASDGQAARATSLLSGVLATATTGAPLLGSYLTQHLGWRAGFLFITILAGISLFACALWVDESLPRSRRPSVSSLRGWPSLSRSLMSATFWANAWVSIFLYAALLVYLSNVSLVLRGSQGMDIRRVGVLQLSILLSFVGASLAGGLRRVSPLCTRLGTGSTLIGIVVLLLTQVFGATVVVIHIGIAAVTAGFGLLLGVTSSRAFALLEKDRGSGSALFTAVRLLFAATLVSAVAGYFDGTLSPAVCAIVLLATASMVSLFLASRYPPPRHYRCR